MTLFCNLIVSFYSYQQNNDKDNEVLIYNIGQVIGLG